jgi:hypothetical protein
MGQTYKILGQAQGQAASAQQTLNYFPDPNFEQFTGNTSQNPGNLGIWQNYHDSNGHTNTNYDTGGYGTLNPSRTNEVYFSQHATGTTARWNINPSFRPYLSANKTYTLSLWYYYNNDNNDYYYGGVRSSHFLNYGFNNEQDGGVQIQNNNGSGAASLGYYNNWTQHYATFTGQNNYFNIAAYLHCNHYTVWQRIYLDNIYLIEGALPQSLVPSKAPDGSSGNPNALYTAPFTTRSEGWSGTAYNSSSVRKLTGAWQTLYTCPDIAGESAVASSLTITNTGTSAATYRVAIQKAGETLTNKHLLSFDTPISANSTDSLTLGLTIGRADKVLVQSDSSQVQFALYGSENSA